MKIPPKKTAASNTNHRPKRRMRTNRTLTPLDTLLDRHVIQETMHTAALVYAELCHKNPVGGPHMSRTGSMVKIKQSGARSPLGDDSLDLWDQMRHILDLSAIKSLADALILENDVDALVFLMKYPKAMTRFKKALEDFVECLDSFKEEPMSKHPQQ